MRSIILMAMFMASFSSAAADDYTEVRDLKLNAGSLEKLIIDAGAGSLDVTGIDGLKSIEVKATIIVPDASEEDGKEIIARQLTLTLKEVGGEARLKSDFDQRSWSSGSNSRVDLEVRAPASLGLAIDDGSGSMEVANFATDVWIDDGSGSIDVRGVGNLRIHDGSGSIDVVGANGDVFVDDGSGSISIDAVGGSVTIDDGSGGIRVSDVAEDLIILDDGSGGVTYTNIRGNVEEEG